MNSRSRGIVAATAFAVPLSPAACGSSNTASSPAPGAASQTSAETMASSGSDASTAVFGSGCTAVPKHGKGSFNGMATDPVATAASNNPLLKTLVTAVGADELGDTLNTKPDITVFAPINDAFAHTTPAGGTLKVTGSGEAFKVNGGNNIICGNVPTANATVYIVDGVLLPS